jgi:S1-C subfamily serine protease
MRKAIRDRSLKGLVDVYHTPRSPSTGFLVGGDYAVTAAHCLPCLPKQLTGFLRGDVCPVKVRARSTKAKFDLDIMFADPCSDLAVLSYTGEELLPYLDFAEGLEPLPLCLDELPLQKPVPAHIFTNKGKWISGKATLCSHVSAWLSGEFTEAIPGGTSGSPVFDDKGRVLGVVSSASMILSGNKRIPIGGHFVYLANALPRWLTRKIVGEA